jgi:hypothetical protein
MDLADSFVYNDLDKYNNLINKAIIQGGKERIFGTMRFIANECADSIRESIDTQSFTELAPKTVELKGSDVQLIETNTLYEQAKGKVTNNTQK